MQVLSPTQADTRLMCFSPGVHTRFTLNVTLLLRFSHEGCPCHVLSRFYP